MEIVLLLFYNARVHRRRTTGSREAFGREAVAYLDHLYRIAFHLAKDQTEAEDLVQETFVRALARYDQFKAGTNMKAWLTKILHNFFLDQYHQKKRWMATEPPDEQEYFWERVPADNPGPETEILVKELNTRISDVLRKIPEEFRAAIVLVDMGDFSYEQAAEILSCPIGTIRSRLSRARRLMHQHLTDYVVGGHGPKDK